jgi:hypothetical protein
MAGDAKQLEKEERELQGDLDELIEDTIRQEAPKNAAIWLGAVLGSFVVVLAMLWLVTGG